MPGDPKAFYPQDLTARRMAAERLLAEGKAKRQAQTAGIFKVGGTLLGALVGTLIAPGAGTVIGSQIGGGIGSLGAAAVNPGDPGLQAGVQQGVQQGSTALDRLLRIMREEEEAGTKGPITL